MTSDQLPLAAFECFRTSDLKEASRHVEQILSAHSVAASRPGASFDIRYHAVDLLDCAVLFAQYGAGVRLDPGALDDFYLVGMTLAGSSTVSCGGSELITHTGLASVQSCRQPVSTEWHEGCRKLSVKIRRDALEQRLERLLGRPVLKPVQFDIALNVSQGVGASWQRLIRHVLTELAPDSVYLRSAHSRRALSDTLISTLLLIQPHNYSDQLLADPEPAAPRHVRRVEELIAADPSLPHTPSELARQVGVSVRNLQAGFRRYRHTTPMEFVRNQRLMQARKLLAEAAEGTTVTGTALDVGYTHMGRFSRDYRAAFGESPSQTLRTDHQVAA